MRKKRKGRKKKKGGNSNGVLARDWLVLWPTGQGKKDRMDGGRGSGEKPDSLPSFPPGRRGEKKDAYKYVSKSPILCRLNIKKKEKKGGRELT